MKRFLLLLSCCLPFISIAQTPTQTIRGQVIDADTRQALVGAKVIVVDSEPAIGAITDEEGKFRLEKVPIGRHNLQALYVGYAPFISDNIILSSVKELVLNIELREAIGETTTEEVIISASEHPHQARNELSVVSTRSFSAEETERYAASVNDIGRMAITFPGVQMDGNDRENFMIIRGNTSYGILWRLEGIDIPNPNHYSRPASGGGAITVFSAQLLANSDVSTGAFAAEYGNAMAGVFDIRFRKGNTEKREYRFKAGLLGLDFATEGPIQKGRSSYLINYRYSTLSLLNKMGFHLVGEYVDHKFQDLSFNLSFPSKDRKSLLTLFGLGGLSREHYFPIPDTSLWVNTGDWEDEIRPSNMGALGLTYTRQLDDKSYLKAVVAGVGSDLRFTIDTFDTRFNKARINTEQYRSSRLVGTVVYNRKFSTRTRFKAGLIGNHILYKFFWDRFLLSDILVNGEGSTQLLQGYAQVSHNLTEKLVFNAGLHSMFLNLNRSASLEPRLSIKYQPKPKTTLAAAYGLHSQMVPLGYYFIRLRDENQALYQPNLDLKLMKSHHAVLSFNQVIGRSLRLQAEVYYQRLFDIPVVDSLHRTFFLPNKSSGYEIEPLVSAGTGYNAGLDLVLEQFFSRGFFAIAKASWIDSRYQALDKSKTFHTRLDNDFAGSLSLGKEFTFKKGNVLQLGGRAIYNDGYRFTPPDQAASLVQGRYVPLDHLSFTEQTPYFFRIDARLSYRINRPKFASVISLDVQNVSNRINTNELRYYRGTQSFDYYRQSGLLPILSMQFDFLRFPAPLKSPLKPFKVITL